MANQLPAIRKLRLSTVDYSRSQPPLVYSESGTKANTRQVEIELFDDRGVLRAGEPEFYIDDTKITNAATISTNGNIICSLPQKSGGYYRCYVKCEGLVSQSFYLIVPMNLKKSDMDRAGISAGGTSGDNGSSGGGASSSQLNAPRQIRATVSGNTTTVQWTAVTNASKYTIKIDSGAGTTPYYYLDIKSTSYEITTKLSAGTQISVKAIGSGYEDSIFSQPVTKLSAPSLSFEGKSATVQWDAVNGAVGYEYKINNSSPKTTTATQCDLSNDGDRIAVKAIGDGTSYFDSDYSDELTFTKTGKQLSTPILKVDTSGYFSWRPYSDSGNATSYAIKEIYYYYGELVSKTSTASSSNLGWPYLKHYGYQVQAKTTKDSYADSDWSEMLIYKSKLSVPSVAIGNDGTATWSSQVFAISYEYSINGIIKKLMAQTGSLSVQLKSGDKIQVRAIGDGSFSESSEWSEEMTFTQQGGGPDGDNESLQEFFIYYGTTLDKINDPSEIIELSTSSTSLITEACTTIPESIRLLNGNGYVYFVVPTSKGDNLSFTDDSTDLSAGLAKRQTGKYEGVEYVLYRTTYPLSFSELKIIISKL